MKTIFKFTVPFFVLLFVLSSYAEMTLYKIEGNAQVQREGKRVWKRIGSSETFSDNDVIKTGYRSKIILRIDKLNHIVLGSNTKALINYNKTQRSIPELSITLFKGALFSKIDANISFSVFTTTGSMSGKNVSFSTIVENKSGRTGIQVISGSLSTKNLIQKDKYNIEGGNASVIEANSEPRAPKPLTTRHIDILSKFFGSKYIAKEIKKSGIKLISAKVSTTKHVSKTSVSKKSGYEYEKELRGSLKLKPLFSIDKIFGNLDEATKEEKAMFSKVLDYDDYWNSDRFVEASIGNAFYDDNSYMCLGLRGGLMFKHGDVSLRFPFVPEQNGSIGTGEWSDVNALLEKIEAVNLHFENRGLYLEFGKISPVTIGYGLAVENFSYNQPGAPVQKSGLRLGVESQNYMLEVITPDVTKWDIIIPSFIFENGAMSFNFAYIIDRDQSLGLSKGDIGFLSRDELPALSSVESTHQYDIEFAFNTYYHPPFWLQIHLGFSQILSPSKGNIGYGIIFPSFMLTCHTWKFLLETRAYSDKFIAPYYNPFTAQDRASLISGTKQVTTLNQMISDNNSVKGIKVGIAKNVFRKSEISFSYFQNVLGYKSISDSSFGGVSNVKVVKDSDYKKDATMCLNFKLHPDAIKRIKELSLYFETYHSDYFGYDLFRMSPQTKMGFSVSTLVMQGLEVKLQGKSYFIDKSGQYDPKELGRCDEIQLGFVKHL